MIKITGIIAEFNPFHNGHKHLLTQAQGLKIVVMSGNWVQRGEPAIFDKWIRAKMALENGADIVVELPTQISVQSADFFARGAVDILAELGCETLIFGSETTIDYNEISKNYAQNAQEMEAFIAALPDDFSYPEKTQRMWQHFSTVTFDGNTPNHVLGLAYAKACAKKQIQLQSIVRLGASHDSKSLRQPAPMPVVLPCDGKFWLLSVLTNSKNSCRQHWTFQTALSMQFLGKIIFHFCVIESYQHQI